jgi:uncharacterized protein DUF6982
VAQSTNKKVLLARFDREPVEGFVQAAAGFDATAIEVLTPSGTLLRIPIAETKAVCFVRDFEAGETWREHRSFLTRPKMPGIWLRLLFRDGDSLEGMLPNNLMLIDTAGFNIIPPDPTFQNQRIFVPRQALREVQVLGIVGSPLRRRPAKKEIPEGQLEMFDPR